MLLEGATLESVKTTRTGDDLRVTLRGGGGGSATMQGFFTDSGATAWQIASAAEGAGINNTPLFLLVIQHFYGESASSQMYQNVRFDGLHRCTHDAGNNQRAAVQRCGRRAKASMRRGRRTVRDQAAWVGKSEPSDAQRELGL